MQSKEAKGAEGANDEEQPEGDGNDEGPSAPHDAGNVVPDTVEGRRGTAEGDQDREV
jgi:hypothetical protein